MNKYLKNINYLMKLERKNRYDRVIKYEIGEIEGKIRLKIY